MPPKCPFFFLRHFSNKSTTTTAPKLKNVLTRYRGDALAAGRLALTDYLHFTRSLPFSLSDQIASNSPIALSLFLSRIPFPPNSVPSSFPSTIQKFLPYHPINEVEFFSESISLPPSVVQNDTIFLSDNPTLIEAVLVLFTFGFPFPKLGLMLEVFNEKEDDLRRRLKVFSELGLGRICLIGACLAFPWVLKSNMEDKAQFLFEDLKAVLSDCGLNDIDKAFEICRKVRILYESGAGIGKIGEILVRNKHVLFEACEDVLRWKLNFFLNLGMDKEEAWIFVLNHVDVFDTEFESLDIHVPEILVNVLGLDEVEIERVFKIYPHVLGKNHVGNFPGILKALDLNKRFVDKIVNVDLHCLKVLSCKITTKVCASGDTTEEEFMKDLEIIKSKKEIDCIDNKIHFLASLGFGRNRITSKIIPAINGTSDQLQERFDCLIGFGIKHSDVCRMIIANPKFLNQRKEQIHKKVNYLCHELGYPVDYLHKFPAYLCFDLENRIKPRYEILNWLKGCGLVKKDFSPATLLANSEKRFIVNLYGIHPAAPKQWLEKFSPRRNHRGYQKNIFAL